MLIFSAFIYAERCVGQVTSLYTQNFGTGTTFPTGWSSINTNPWTISTTNPSTTPTYSGGSNAAAGSFINARTLLFSNNISTIGYTNITVLWAARKTLNKVLTFEWSADGSNWNTLAISDVATNSTWAWVNGGAGARISLPAGAVGAANLSFRWTFDTDGTSGAYRIDDFSIEGCKVPNQPSVITGSSSPCSGSTHTYSVTNVGGVTYTWSFPSGWVITSGGGSSVVIVTVGVTPGNITVTPSNACGNGNPSTLAVTIGILPSQPSAIVGPVSVCSGSSQNYSVTNVPGVIYTWVLPPGWTQTAGGTSNSIVVTVSAISGNVQVTPSNSCGSGTLQQLSVNSQVSAPGQPGAIVGNTSVCQGVSCNYSVPAIGGVIYTWGFPAGWVITGGQGTSSITVIPGINSGVIILTPSNVCGNGTAISQNVLVFAIPSQPSLISGSTSCCLGNTLTFSVSDISGVSFNWLFPADWSITSGQGTNSVSVIVGPTSGMVQVTPSNFCGIGTSRSLSVSVVDVPLLPGSISGNSLVCKLSTQIYSVNNVAGVTYTWTLPAGWNIISGQGTNIINATASSVSGNVIVTPSNSCGLGPIQTLSVTVQTAAPVQPSPISGIGKPCVGSSLIYSTNNVAGVTYTWTVPAGWIITSGQGSNSITVTVGATSGNIIVSPSNTCGGGASRLLSVIPVSTIPAIPSPISGSPFVCMGVLKTYNVTFVSNVTFTWTVPSGWVIQSGQGTRNIQVNTGATSGIISVTASNACGSGPVQSLFVTVQNSVPAQPGPISGSNLPCEGSAQQYNVNDTSGYTYAWSLPSDWVIVSGQGTFLITVLVGVQSGMVQVVPSNGCGNGVSASLAVSPVLLPSSSSAISGEIYICESSNQTYSVAQIPGITYTWQIPAGWSFVNGQGGHLINVVAGGVSGNVSVTPSNGCGDGPSVTLNVASNPIPEAFTGPNAYICTGASVQLGKPTNATSSFSWSSIPPGFVSTISNPIVTPNDTTTYILIETDTISGCSYSNSIIVTVDQIIEVSVNPVSHEQIICSGTTTDIHLTSNISGTLFSWTALLTGGTGTTFQPTGTGTHISEIITNSSSLSSVVTYHIVAAANECSDSSIVVVVTINPTPYVNSQAANICSDVPTGVILGASTNGVFAVGYNITGINSNGLVASAGNPTTGNGLANNVISDDAWVNATVNPVNVIYTIVPVSSQGCEGAPFTVTITVNSKPAISNSLTFEICSGHATAITLSANLPSTFTWTLGIITGNITGATAGSGSGIAQILTNPGNTNDGTVQYIVTPKSVSGSCYGNPTVLLVTVHPKPVITNANNTAICSGTAFSLSLAATVTCNFSWTIGIVTGGITGAIAGNGNLINQILSNPSNILAGSVQYLVTPISLPYNCQGDPFIITVTVNPLATVTASSSVNSVCPETNFNLFSSSSMSPPALLLAENFNSATNTWSKTNTSTGGTTANAAWTLRPDGYVTNSVTFHSNDNSQFYMSDSRLQNGTVTAVSLVSPVMSTMGYSSLSLSFWHYYDFNSTSGEFAKVEVSTNNGASWNTVATYTGDRGAANGFQNENIDLGAAYINSTTFQVRFNYFCGSNRGRYWAIDNASVSGIPIVTPEISWTSNPEGFSSIVANPTGISQVITTVYNVHYINPVTTCNSEASVSVSSLPVPEPNILADYCIVPGMIRLTASVGSTYLWNTGETSRIIEVDIAGVYSVVVTNVSGCSATAFFAVSVEKVVNGDFSAGNNGFTSGYVYDPTANGLIAPESEYAINSDAHYTHTNFWGYDHTSGSGTGNDNFLIVNGAKYAPQPFVWRETVSVQPNTNYYFSAWAKSLNNVLPFAELRFSVNGTQVGTTAFLTTGQNILNNPWLLKDRFYGMWNSGASTSAMIEILDLNTSANGNDFGLDDISFGTLAQIPFTIDPTSNKGNFCMGETLQLYANIDGGRPPISFQWTGPNGFTSLLTNPVVPNIPVAGGGKYYLTVTDGYGCNPVTDSVAIVVLALPTATVTGNTSACQYAPSPVITFTGFGGTAPYSFVFNINNGTNQTLTTSSGNTATMNVPTSIVGSYSYNLVSVTSANTCFQYQTGSITVNINSLPTCIIMGECQVCPETSNNVYSGLVGMSSYSWSVSGNGSITGSFTNPDVNITSGITCSEIFTVTLFTSDLNGCNAICQEEVLVSDDVPPVVTCPVSISTMADANKNYATVILQAPGVSDNCTSAGNIGLTWTMTLPTAGSGSGIISSPFQFNVGTTTISYHVTDACGNTANCSFQVVVAPNNPPTINCPANISINTTSGLCTALVNPGQPTLVLGTEPITWTWTLTGATSANGTGSPISPNPYPFNKGITTIMWVATNISGSDTCYHTITVIDNEPPTFTTPGPFRFCVENIYLAGYYDPTMDITPDRPEYHTLPTGSTELNMDVATFSDNCPLTCAVEIRWRITFSDGTVLPELPDNYIVGQPSMYGNEIQLPGALAGNVIHTITYQIVDCNANVSAQQSVIITVTPRPNVIKQ